MIAVDEQFFARCTFCLKDNQMIVFDVEWRGQLDRASKRYIRKGKVWLCHPCSKDYKLEINNFDYDEKAVEMCEALA